MNSTPAGPVETDVESAWQAHYEPYVTMRVHGTSIAIGIIAALTVGDAVPQALSELPVQGAPVAQSGPYGVLSEPAFRSPGHVIFRPASLDAFPRDDTLLDGAYLVGTDPPVFRRIAPPSEAELQRLVERVAERIGRALERQGVLVRDAEGSYLELGPDAAGPLDDLIGHSITYRVAVGPRAGQKVFLLRTVPARAEEARKGVAQYAGFSLHAGIGVEAEQRDKLERLTRYVSRPAVAEERLDLTAQGQVRYRLKTPYRDGTTHIVLEPLDFMARLAALVPPPRVHLTRFHGVFAAHAALRAAITPGRRGPGSSKRAVAPESPTPKEIRLNWARRLKRVFGIEIEQCARCGGRLKVIASIEDPELIERILAHRREWGEEAAPTTSLGARAPPQASLF
jgi:hypothetical protein